jgi:hypothetical protein
VLGYTRLQLSIPLKMDREVGLVDWRQILSTRWIVVAMWALLKVLD